MPLTYFTNNKKIFSKKQTRIWAKKPLRDRSVCVMKSHGPGVTRWLMNQKFNRKVKRKGDNSSYLLLSMIGKGFHDDGGFGLDWVVKEMAENLSKLPLGRASGTLLEKQLERSIAVHQSTFTGSHPASLPATPTIFWKLTTCDRRSHDKQILHQMAPCYVWLQMSCTISDVNQLKLP